VPRSFRLAALLVPALATVVLALPTPRAKAPAPAEIKKAIDDLASPRFAVRERASKVLWQAGAAAEPALREAAKSADEETANRAKAILEKFDWGLYPDTPPDLVKLIQKFQGGDPAIRQEVVGELIRMKPPRFVNLRKLIAHEQNDDARQQMYASMAGHARTAIPGLIVANQLDEAGELLEICVSPDQPGSMTDYAAFHHLRNTVPDAIRRMQAARKNASGDEARRAAACLVYLYRVQKDWPAARKAAADAGDRKLLHDVAWESNDWKTLSEAPTDPDNPDDRGERAAYHRLAGNRAKYDETIAELRKELTGVEGDDSAAYQLAYALLLNGQGPDAIAILKDRGKRGADLAFELLCAQLKFREAFAYADKVAKELEKDEDQPEFARAQLAIRRGKMLAVLGEKDAATQIFRGLTDKIVAPKEDASLFGMPVELVKAAARSGMRELAAECAARALANVDKNGRLDEGPELLEPIFDEQRFVALTWWRALRTEKPDEEPAATMARVLALASGKAERKDLDRLATLLASFKAKPRVSDGISSTITLTFPGEGNFAIGEAYRAAGVLDKAEEFYKKATAEKPKAPARIEELLDLTDPDGQPSSISSFDQLLRYGDFLLERKRFKEAAGAFKRAWDLAPVMPLPLFLSGHALAQAGDAKEGARLLGLAHWIPLGNEGLRTKFSEDLTRRGFPEDSRKEMELVLQAGWFRTYYVGNVHLRMGRLLARQKNYATAARYYEKDVISLFRTSAHFVDAKGYLTVPELTRTYRAKALLAAGKIDEALAEARIGLAVLPGNVELAIGFVPDLERAGRKKDADDIYAQVKSALSAAIQEYGSSAELRNSLAWTLVNCNRELDEAQKHAEKAVELAPKAAGYIDTLAEIHFRKKDRAKALELMKQCAKLEPTNPYFRKQLERFEKKPFDSPLPDEETGDD
jgi:tetratricopeptide (TPR) repeat protein